jgi:TRAP-type uncharacterized transport system fused permease subunit
MLQGDWTIWSVAYVVFKAVLAIVLWAAATTGYLWSPLGWPARLLAVLAASLLVVAVPLTDEAGFALGAAFIGWQAWRRRSLARQAGRPAAPP